MADLLALQPNLNIPLFLVAPEDRRSKVISEINRPTFSQLNPPLVEVCRYISFESLSSKLTEVSSFVRYLKPDFLQGIASKVVLWFREPSGTIVAAFGNQLGSLYGNHWSQTRQRPF
jgi:hypothetical protein